MNGKRKSSTAGTVFFIVCDCTNRQHGVWLRCACTSSYLCCVLFIDPATVGRRRQTLFKTAANNISIKIVDSWNADTFKSEFDTLYSPNELPNPLRPLP
jgi:hypothetical protein